MTKEELEKQNKERAKIADSLKTAPKINLEKEKEFFKCHEHRNQIRK